jgi:hypothetical protein
MGCNNKIKNTCGTKSFATCVEYQGTVSENTTLEDIGCVDVQEVIEDLYAIVDIIKEEIDMSEVTSDCYTLPEPKTVKSLIEAILARLCAQQVQIDDLIEQVNTQAEEILALQENNCN